MVTHKAFKQTNHEEQCLHTRQVEVDKVAMEGLDVGTYL